jgi:hypothetical protein
MTVRYTTQIKRDMYGTIASFDLGFADRSLSDPFEL